MPAKQEVQLVPFEIEAISIQLVGDSPLITHAWSEEAKREILSKQMKLAMPAKAAKDPEALFRASLYHHPEGGYGFPGIAFKQAAVDACRQMENITMTKAIGAFHVMGEFVKIEGSEPQMREDMVRLQGTTADIRFRAQFTPWSTVITVRHNPRVLSAEQLVNMFNFAGFSVGVGNWRPEKKGTFGMFHVEGGP